MVFKAVETFVISLITFWRYYSPPWHLIERLLRQYRWWQSVTLLCALRSPFGSLCTNIYCRTNTYDNARHGGDHCTLLLTTYYVQDVILLSFLLFGRLCSLPTRKFLLVQARLTNF